MVQASRRGYFEFTDEQMVGSAFQVTSKQQMD
jgi:hypothetical protein